MDREHSDNHSDDEEEKKGVEMADLAKGRKSVEDDQHAEIALTHKTPQRRFSDPGTRASLSSIFGPSDVFVYSRKLPVLLGYETKATAMEQALDEHRHDGEESDLSPHHGPPDNCWGKFKFYGKIAIAKFMGPSPIWYKYSIIGMILLNPFFMLAAGHYAMGWLLTAEFIYTLAMALYCYPLQPGGLIVIEAIAIGMVPPKTVYYHVEENLPVILLLMFMVAAIHFMKPLLRSIFMRLFLGITDKTTLSLILFVATVVLGGFLDSLTVTAVILAVAASFYAIYHKVATEESLKQTFKGKARPKPKHAASEGDGEGGGHGHGGHGGVDHHKLNDDSALTEEYLQTLEEFRDFLRSILMHVIVATAVGGVATEVGEPQNLMIAEKVGWTFMEYLIRCLPVSVFTLLMALITCWALERFPKLGRCFGYGGKIPPSVLKVLQDMSEAEAKKQTHNAKVDLYMQAVCALLLVILLSGHVAEVGLIGLAILVLLTILNGTCEAEPLGEAFVEGLPFCGLLVVFFCVAAIIEETQLFRAMVYAVLDLHGKAQYASLFCIVGLLSTMSDNVFVAAVYINEVFHAYETDHISAAELNLLAVAINVATNVPSLATPNGQAAFLYLYTSPLAPLVRLSYFKMVWMALPYTITLSIISLIITVYIREFTESMVAFGWLPYV